MVPQFETKQDVLPKSMQRGDPVDFLLDAPGFLNNAGIASALIFVPLRLKNALSSLL
jgi:hypothetical protein